MFVKLSKSCALDFVITLAILGRMYDIVPPQNYDPVEIHA